MKNLRLFLFLLLAAVTPQAGFSAIVLPDILGSHMVLQRNRPLPIWGKADPGEIVTVTFGGKEKTARADAQGNWKAVLDPMPANLNPSVMVISGSNRIELTDLLVGEVWLCSGQSNMQWMLQQSKGGAEAILKADYPHIRLFNVSREVAFKRKEGKLASWQVCSPATVADFSGAGYFFGLELYKSLKIPVGLVNSSYGGSQAEAWTPVEYLAANEALKPCIEREKIWDAERPAVKAAYDAAVSNWKAAVEKAKAEGKPAPGAPGVPDALRDYRIAASIYNNMIAPLIPFAIRGALWYQGESNEARAEQYEILLPTMIRAWRERWAQGDFPFAIVQLPNYRNPSPQPADEAWSHLRDAQRKTFLSTPNTGLIVTIDIGEAADIHPTNKQDVGSRIWRWAMADVYGEKMIKSGPVFDKAKFTPTKAILSFREVGKGLKTCDGKPLQSFAIAGADQQFVWANARIVGKNKIEVWSDQIASPQSVRYAFNNNPVGPNLSNETCLPAGPFRTDNWPGPTAGKR